MQACLIHLSVLKKLFTLFLCEKFLFKCFYVFLLLLLLFERIIGVLFLGVSIKVHYRSICWNGKHASYECIFWCLCCWIRYFNTCSSRKRLQFISHHYSFISFFFLSIIGAIVERNYFLSFVLFVFLLLFSFFIYERVLIKYNHPNR